MQLSSTWIVAPNYLAYIMGFDAVEVTARKLHLIRQGRRVKSATYKQADKVAGKSFADLVDFVKANSKE